MSTFVVVASLAVLVVRPGRAVETHLQRDRAGSLAVDHDDPARLYAGTGRGLRRSADGGRHWESVGGAVAHHSITAVAVSGAEGGAVYAGTNPSAVFRSDDHGDNWTDLAGMKAVPSAPTWSFPPQPDTHHVRWIEADPNETGRVFVAVEAGALLRTDDGGRSWNDRVPGGPYDTHTAATHSKAPGRVYSAAGDGYFESRDGGASWARDVAGLKHRYLVGVVVHSQDPDTVIVSASAGPYSAYAVETADAYVYRKTAGRPFELAMEGLPEARGTVASRFATNLDEPGVIYAVNNHGLFRTADAGRRWSGIEVPWADDAFERGVEALACLPD